METHSTDIYDKIQSPLHKFPSVIISLDRYGLARTSIGVAVVFFPCAVMSLSNIHIPSMVSMPVVLNRNVDGICPKESESA